MILSDSFDLGMEEVGLELLWIDVLRDGWTFKGLLTGIVMRGVEQRKELLCPTSK